MPKSNAQRGKEFRERKKRKKLAAKSSRKSDKNTQKNSANSSSDTAKSPTEYIREYGARKKTLQSTLNVQLENWEDFQKRFIDNPFGHRCSIYDRLWLRDHLRTPVAEHKNIL
ncbi:hypothetical protein TNCV_1844991 [Trichonephila clavipes]|nr:hypothetical protein TNCV_1844991 [Trichonephila clavipes]